MLDVLCTRHSQQIENQSVSYQPLRSSAYYTYVTRSAKTLLVLVLRIEKNKNLNAKELRNAFMEPVLEETRIKSIKTTYHLIHLLTEFGFISVAPNIKVIYIRSGELKRTVIFFAKPPSYQLTRPLNLCIS